MAENEIAPGIEILDLALWLPGERTLIFGDLHLGIEEAMNLREGVLLPRKNFEDIKKRLKEKVFGVTGRVKRVIINGDLKHEFGAISKQEWKEVIQMVQFIAERCDEVLLVKGNHDRIIGPLAGWSRLKLVDEFYITDIHCLALHGHEVKNSESYKKAKILVMCHDHPAITIREGAKAETYKAFLKGTYNGKTLIVLPSLNSVRIGTNIANEQTLSPMLKGSLKEFEVWAVEDKPYYFGKLGGLG